MLQWIFNEYISFHTHQSIYSWRIKSQKWNCRIYIFKWPNGSNCPPLRLFSFTLQPAISAFPHRTGQFWISFWQKEKKLVLLGWPENAGWWLSSQPAVKWLRSGVREFWHLTVRMYKALCNPRGTQIPHSDTQPHRQRRMAPGAWAGEFNGRYISTFSLDSWRGQKGHHILSVVSFNEFGSTGCIPPQPISEQTLSTTCGREGADSGPNPTLGI